MQGHYGKAEPIEGEVLDLHREVLGAKHPDTLQAMQSLAISWHACGRRDNALCLMRQCLQVQQVVLGPHYPSTKESAQFLVEWDGKSRQVLKRWTGKILAVFKPAKG